MCGSKGVHEALQPDLSRSLAMIDRLSGRLHDQHSFHMGHPAHLEDTLLGVSDTLLAMGPRAHVMDFPPPIHPAARNFPCHA